MRRFIRWTLRLTALLLILLLLSLASTLTTVDSRPFEQTDYYQQSLSRIQNPTNGWQSTGPLHAGFAKALLTPPLNPIPLAGFGNRRGAPATGVHDGVFSRAIALRVGTNTLLFVSADALIVPREIADLAASELASKYNLPRHSIYFGATHTHASLGGWGRGTVGEMFAGPFNPKSLTWFSDSLVNAATNAIANLSPASLGTTSFEAPNLVRNRLIGDSGPTEPTFSCLWIQKSNGDQAVIGTFSAHATVVGSSNMQFSGDYPGAWSHALEKEGLQVALFLAGPVASHSPAPPSGGFEGAITMGNQLANLTLHTLPTTTLTNQVTLKTQGAFILLPRMQPRITQSIALRPWIAKQLLVSEPNAFIQTVALNHTLFTSTPCDFSDEIGDAIDESLPDENWSSVYTSFNGDYTGYVIPSKYYTLPGYESRTMAFYGPGFADYLASALVELHQQVTN
ncbi:MAG: neutral/alkaline non-lysosomal ceramidase N-terminal domain-containing protein [Limisphaerales bacterium]